MDVNVLFSLEARFGQLSNQEMHSEEEDSFLVHTSRQEADRALNVDRYSTLGTQPEGQRKQMYVR